MAKAACQNSNLFNVNLLNENLVQVFIKMLKFFFVKASRKFPFSSLGAKRRENCHKTNFVFHPRVLHWDHRVILMVKDRTNGWHTVKFL